MHISLTTKELLALADSHKNTHRPEDVLLLIGIETVLREREAERAQLKAEHHYYVL